MQTELIRGLSHLTPRHQGCVATIGNFDGVHVGHQALIKKLSEKAKELNAQVLVITFEPQPLEFFGKGTPRLTKLREKFCALQAYGVNKVLAIQFNQQFANMTAEEFIKKILAEKLALKYILVGDDFRFGKGRVGDFDYLEKIGKEYNIVVENMPTIKQGHERVSSTLVREHLMRAELEKAAQLLGRPYTMMGRIVHGNKMGRKLDCPTANIFLHRTASPVQGIFAVKMHGIKAQGLPGVANVGTCPTVGGTKGLLEVHLLDFDADIYNRHVTVEFCKKFRDELKFENLDLLKQAIAKDIVQGREYFHE